MTSSAALCQTACSSIRKLLRTGDEEREEMDKEEGEGEGGLWAQCRYSLLLNRPITQQAGR